MLFYFKGLEDKEQNLTRRISTSDILSEKVRYYFVGLKIYMSYSYLPCCSLFFCFDLFRDLISLCSSGWSVTCLYVLLAGSASV